MTTAQQQRWSTSSGSRSSGDAEPGSFLADIRAALDYPSLQYGQGPTETVSPAEALAGDKGKARYEMTDEELARSLFAEEALKNLAEYNDEYAGLADGRIWSEQADIMSGFRSQQSAQAMDDLDLAFKLIREGKLALEPENPFVDPGSQVATGSAPNPLPGNTPATQQSPAELLLIYRELTNAGMLEPGSLPPNVTTADCGVCGERIEGKSADLSCGHRYDINCLMEMFSANVNDETRFPPRCCGTVISMTHVEEDLTPDKVILYRAKMEEYQTPFRLYCSNKECATFLGARQDRASSVTCTGCQTRTCSACSDPAHDEKTKCKIDKGLRKALVLGQSHGWQRCPGCRQLVERNMGCYHMSCRCGAQFCYICAAPWKTCSCTGGTSLFLRLLGARKLKFRGNYLLKSEFGANNDGMVKRICKKSWKGVVGVVTPSSRN